MPLLRKLAMIGAALLLGAAASPDRSRLNAAVFDKAWTTVADRYWDPAMRGLDWDAMRIRFRPKALAAPDSLALYAVLDEMLSALGDGHVYAITPGERRGQRQDDADGPDFAALRMGPGDILLLRVPGFAEGADRWLVRQLAAPLAPSAVILDLRDNGGGLSDVLDRIAGAFFERNRPVLRVMKRRPRDEMTRGAGPSSFKGPLAVLVGPNSASAAEAFAALIEESGRGVTVGERTAGSLADGVHYRLPDGGELSVAEFDIRTPAGRRLEGSGFVPRHVVKPSLEQRQRGEDPALRFAQELLSSKGR